MKCPYEEIALYAGGDLPAEEIEALETHLAGCAACREFAGDLRVSQKRVSQLAEADVDEAPLAWVRAGVLATIARRRKVVVITRWALAAAAAIALAVLPLMQKPEQPIAKLPQQRLTPVPAEPKMSPVQRAAHPIRKPRKRPAPVEYVKVPKQELLEIRMLTDDPDVVIIWFVDGGE